MPDTPRVVFDRLYPWALEPAPLEIDKTPAEEKASLYEGTFRWLKATRSRELCWPWRLAQEIGWVVRCPVDIEMQPFDDVEVDGSDTKVSELADILGDYDLWRRSTTSIAVPRAQSRWLRLYDFKTDSGFESMFIPNGGSSLEWHLGWGCEIPVGYYLMTIPFDTNAGIEVFSGVLDARTLKSMRDKLGFSIAVKPKVRCSLRRGDPIARVILLHPDSLRAK